MAIPTDPPGKKRYRAFISHSRRDRRIAQKLHRALEAYRAPKNANPVGEENRRLGRLFLDTHELAASDDLGAALNGALDDSDHLIVIASPSAARSRWVEAEVARFKGKSTGRVFAVIASGAPHTGNFDTECFPPSLHASPDGGRGSARDGAEPLAADLTQERFGVVLIRLVAGLLDIPFDDLWNRERRRRRLRRGIASAATALAAVGVSWGGALLQR